jgi:hypothetical protein
MKIQESAENYLEAILKLSLQNGQVRSIDIVNELHFSKPSISYAMKLLRENGYILMDTAGLITLTDEGRAIAERIFNRHNVLSRYLIALGVAERQRARTPAALNTSSAPKASNASADMRNSIVPPASNEPVCSHPSVKALRNQGGYLRFGFFVNRYFLHSRGSVSQDHCLLRRWREAARMRRFTL